MSSAEERPGFADAEAAGPSQDTRQVHCRRCRLLQLPLVPWYFNQQAHCLTEQAMLVALKSRCCREEQQRESQSSSSAPVDDASSGCSE